MRSFKNFCFSTFERFQNSHRILTGSLKVLLASQVLTGFLKVLLASQVLTGMRKYPCTSWRRVPFVVERARVELK